MQRFITDERTGSGCERYRLCDCDYRSYEQDERYDGRISPENKTWAQTIPICEGQLNILVDRCNPGLLDLFTNQVRKDFAAEQQRSQQKVSVREKLHGTPARAAERSASSKRDRDAR